MIVSLGSGAFDGLRLCSQARSHERTRNLPILLIADPDDRPKVLRGLELGVNDYLTRPIDRNELLARVRTNIRQKLYADRLRQSVQQSIEMALYDSLTGLNNRRSLERRLPAMIETARAERRAADHDGSRHRPFQARERHLWSRRRRSRAQGLRRSAARDGSERRPHLPSGWRGIRRRDAWRRRRRSGADRGTRAPDHREPGLQSTAPPAPFRLPSRLVSPNGGRTGTQPSFIVERTGRFICRSRRAATASLRTPRDRQAEPSCESQTASTRRLSSTGMVTKQSENRRLRPRIASLRSQ